MEIDKEISIFSNSNHFEWRAALSDTILKRDYPRTIPAKFALIWFSGFRGEHLNVIFYQNLPNLHNRYKSAERKISQKYLEYMLNYSLPCSCSKHLSSFWLVSSNGKLKKFLFLVKQPSWMEGGTVGHNFERDPPCQAWLNLVQRFLRRRFKCDLLSKYA